MTNPEDELVETFTNESDLDRMIDEGSPVEVEYIRGMKVTDSLQEGMKEMSDHLDSTNGDEAKPVTPHEEIMDLLTAILIQQTRVYDLLASDISGSSHKHRTLSLHAEGKFLTDPPFMAEDAWKEDE